MAGPHPGRRGPTLTGRTIAIKDNLAVAGVPMRNGTALLDGYVPDEDATVVERVLDADATILGKAVCESLCFSVGGHTADGGPVRNLYDPSRSTGGSSTGSAALVAAGEVDMAIGGDQGGSVRIPSCWSGIYGLSRPGDWCPTPARSRSNPRWTIWADGAQQQRDVAGLRLAAVREGFDHQGLSEPDVDRAVMRAASSPSSMPLLLRGVDTSGMDCQQVRQAV